MLRPLQVIFVPVRVGVWQRYERIGVEWVRARGYREEGAPGRPVAHLSNVIVRRE